MIGGARREAFEHDAMLRGDCAFGLAVELCWIGAELCPGAALHIRAPFQDNRTGTG